MKNKLKAISIAVCCLVASLWSEAQCMDNQKDILESATVNRTSNIQSSSQGEIASLALEDKSSLTSYLLYPAKATIQSAYEIIKYTTQNPKNAMIIGVVLASQFITVAAQPIICFCNCKNINTGEIRYAQLGSLSPDTSPYCPTICTLITGGNWVMSSCDH